MLALFLVIGAVLSVAIPTQVFASNEEQANKAWDKAVEKGEDGKQDQSNKARDKVFEKCDGRGFIVEAGGQDIRCS